MLISMPGMSSAAYANVFKFFFRQAISSTFRESLRFAPISTQQSGNVLSKHTETTGSQVVSRFPSNASATRDCQKISVLSCSRALSTADDFFFFLGGTSAEGFFRFNSAAKHTREILRSPQMVSIPRGVGNLRDMWYVDGTDALNSAMKFLRSRYTTQVDR
ncbi:hypothetical protein YC2023_098912 [Brassica napus]